jgi:hypothetical protein
MVTTKQTKEVLQMRDLQMYAQKCLNNLHSIGIYPNITADKFKATVQHNSWGMCHSSRNNRTGVITHRITISKQLLDESTPIEALIQNIYHEAIHACDECFDVGHDGKWLEYANKINKAFGMNIKRSHSATELHVKEEKQNLYRCVCPSCKTIFKRTGWRAPKWYAHSERFICAKCNKSSGIKVKIEPMPIIKAI